jgi:hypothetical protein
MLLVLPTGCGKGPKVRHKPGWLASKNDLRRYIDTVHNDPDADIRRATVIQIGKTRHADSEPAVNALMQVAREDQNASVRCAAIRVLGRTPSAKSINTMLAILDAGLIETDTGIRHAPDPVRWEAMKILRRFIAEGALDEHVANVRQAAILHLRTDDSRDVRITAAALLGNDPNRDTATALVGALRHNDFAIVYEAHRSLQRLTGQSHGYNPSAWSQWLQSAAEPFAEGEFAPGADKPWWKL